MDPAALRLWIDELAPACISEDHPRALSFVPTAPTEAATIFDLVVGASSIYAGSWLEGAGAVYAENQALRWIADLAGLPADAGGCFVSGGSAGNLSALVAARDTAATARADAGLDRPRRWRIAASAEAHSSITSTAKVMDIEVIDVPVDERGRLTGAPRRGPCSTGSDPTSSTGSSRSSPPRAPPTPARSTTSPASPRWPTDRDLWFHVDGAYGGAALAAPSVRPLFAGIEQADSLVVDPHKWLFTPFDCAALLYRHPELARRAHTQHAAYLEVNAGPQDDRRPRVGPERLRLPPHPPGPRPAAVVLAGHPRHRRLPRRDRGDAGHHPGRGRPSSPGSTTSSW